MESTAPISQQFKPSDIFHLHREIVGDYREYIESFINIADPKVRSVVEEAFVKGQLWPEPLLQLNSAFDEAGTVESLGAAGKLHSHCAAIFSGFVFTVTR